MTINIRFAFLVWPALAMATLFTSTDSAAQATDALPFETAVVETVQAPLERMYDGTVEATNQATMSAQTSGRVDEVFFDVDDYVEPGQPIVRFTDVEQQAALRQAQAALTEAVAREKQADAEFQRAEGLFQSGSSSQREYDEALAARDAAAARTASSQSAVKTVEQQLEYTLVRAPYAGIVTRRHVEPGESVSVGQPLISGLSLESLRVVVDMPQQVAAKVREHMTAFVLTDEGRVEASEVTIFPFAHSASNTFTVRVELPDGQFALYPGMFVKVAFVVGDANRLLVPTSALLRRSEVIGIYVVSSEGQLRLRQLRVGNEFDGLTEVLAGLSEGERIALDPVRAGIYVKSQTMSRDEQ
jgi:RND family efflux transporter MFP subunit